MQSNTQLIRQAILHYVDSVIKIQKYNKYCDCVLNFWLGQGWALGALVAMSVVSLTTQWQEVHTNTTISPGK